MTMSGDIQNVSTPYKRKWCETKVARQHYNLSFGPLASPLSKCALPLFATTWNRENSGGDNSDIYTRKQRITVIEKWPWIAGGDKK